jgi:hypothetical protein
MEVALRRRLAGVAEIAISQSQQTAAVTFVSGTHEFSISEFSAAVAEAEVEVMSVQAEVCGVVDGEQVLRASVEPEKGLVRLRGSDAPRGKMICVNGRLDGAVEPYELHVMAVRAGS